MMRLATLFFPAAIALVAAACGAGPQRATTIATPSPTIQAKAQPTPAVSDVLKRSLLTLDDMPTGWTSEASDSPSSDSSGAAFCNSTPFAKSASSHLDADFANGQLDTISQTAAAYPSGAAKQAMDALVSALSGCTSWSHTAADGTVIDMKLSPVSFPKLGDQTLALRMDGTSGIAAIALDLVVFRRADYLDLLFHITVGLGIAKVDSAVTEQVARAADAKLAAAMR